MEYLVLVSHVNGLDTVAYEGNDLILAKGAFFENHRAFFTTQDITGVRFYVNGSFEMFPEDL